ncbi:repressor protein CI [Yersinia enterocolitica]|uniref:XRE family transcriptional regulator n=1 Tax=Yersinia mollaretii TaxID=33060 RepID=UPI0005E6805C|nr:helix-turn-helix transcriptional regulator [Yersinia mollaretii]CNK74165.1 repressor protein CI [Yersinia enterocolitica]
MKNTIAERINLAMNELGLTQGSLAKLAGVTQPTIWKLTSGKTQSTGKILEISRALGVHPEWLASGIGPMWDNTKPASDLPTKLESNDFYRVEVLDVKASAGDGYLVSSDFIETIRAIEYTNDQARTLFGNRAADTVKVITVKGDSMSGTIESGDQIFLDMAVNFFDGDGIYVFVFGQTLHVKRLQMVKNTLLVLSDNKNYKEWSIEEADEAQFFVMAKVLLKQSVDYKRF